MLSEFLLAFIPLRSGQTIWEQDSRPRIIGERPRGGNTVRKPVARQDRTHRAAPPIPDSGHTRVVMVRGQLSAPLGDSRLVTRETICSAQLAFCLLFGSFGPVVKRVGL